MQTFSENLHRGRLAVKNQTCKMQKYGIHLFRLERDREVHSTELGEYRQSRHETLPSLDHSSWFSKS